MPPRGGRGRGGRGARGGARGGAQAVAAAQESADAGQQAPLPEANAPEAPPPADQAPVPMEIDTPAAEAPAPARPTRTASRTVSATPGPGGRPTFKPNFTRRSQASRDALAAKEKERQDAIAAEEARKLRAQQKMTRGRGSMRARGGIGGSIRGNPLGPFSAAIPSAGRGYASGSVSRAASEAAGPSNDIDPFRISETPQFADGYHDESSGRINANSFTRHVQQHNDGSNISVRSRQLLPMGIGREEHKEPQLVIATMAELEAREQQISTDEITLRNLAISGEETWAGADQAGPVKMEDSTEVLAIDQLADMRQQGETPAARPRSSAKDPQSAKPLVMAPVDGDDWDQDAHDTAERQKLLDTFVDPPDSESVEDPRYGGVFIFQFPPVMPPLSIDSKENNPVTIIKDEPTDNDIDLTQLGRAGANSASAVDLTKNENDPVKEEEEEVIAIDGPVDPREKFSTHGAGLGDIGEGGFLGDLVVRKSGKAELTWGGGSVKFSMVPGLEVSCLRHAMLLIMDEKKKQEEGANNGAQQAASGGEYGGTAFELGPVMGKFNFAPILSPEEPWVVEPSQLKRGRDKGKGKEPEA